MISAFADAREYDYTWSGDAAELDDVDDAFMLIPTSVLCSSAFADAREYDYTWRGDAELDGVDEGSSSEDDEEEFGGTRLRL